jgi:O-antigen ligase
LAFAAVLLLFKLVSYSKKSFLLFLILSLGFAVFFFSSPKNLKRLKSIQNTTQFSIRHRLQLWRANVGYVKSSPFVGIGYGENKKKKRLLNSFDKDFKTKYKHLGSFLITSPHNEYIDVAASFGLPILFLFIFFLFNVLIYYFKYSSINHKKLHNLLALLFLSTFALAICFDSIGYDNWIIVLIALLPMLYNKHRNSSQKSQPL